MKETLNDRLHAWIQERDNRLDAQQRRLNDRLNGWLAARDAARRDRRREARALKRQQRAERRAARVQQKRAMHERSGRVDRAQAVSAARAASDRAVDDRNRARWQATLEAANPTTARVFERQAFDELYAAGHFDANKIAQDPERSRISAEGPRYDDFRDLINDHRGDGRGVSPGEAMEFARRERQAEWDLTPDQRAARHEQFLREREAAERGGWER